MKEGIMSKEFGNSNLHKARAGRNDEFYTRLEDIEDELQHYTEHFKDKVVYCNCDDPRKSNFYKYFKDNFFELGLKGLITTFYSEEEQTFTTRIESCGGEFVQHLSGDGDFRSEEVSNYLEEADIVVTNPPFSLFRDFIDTMVEYDKKFLVVGNNNAITYKNVFPLIKDCEVWLGVNSNKTLEFVIPNHYEKWSHLNEEGRKVAKVPAVSWFTNLAHSKRNDVIPLKKTYNEVDYQKYDNYDAIEVSRVANIPKDYYGAMGVPITFLTRHNLNQFEILDCNKIMAEGFNKVKSTMLIKDYDSSVRGKPVYARIVIRAVV